MHILAPFSLPGEVTPLIQAGATELYCGVVPREESDALGDSEALNRRRGYDANLWSFEDLETALATAHGLQVPVYVTLNRYYAPVQHAGVLRLIGELHERDVDGLIVVDPGLLLLLKARGPRFRNLAVGTGGSTFNSHTVAFYRSLGATRVILSRHLTVSEVEKIAGCSPPDVELEAFILNSLCPFEDGFCSFYHGHDPPRTAGSGLRTGCLPSYDPWFEGVGCRMVFDVVPSGDEDCTPVTGFAHDREDELRRGGADCGVCALRSFARAGIASVKIVERAFPTARKVAGTRFVRQALEVSTGQPELAVDELQARLRALYAEYTGNACSGYECYYPSAVRAECVTEP